MLAFRMLAPVLLLLGLLQHKAPELVPDLLLWRIEGLHDPKSLMVVTVESTPFGLTQKVEVKAVTLELLPAKDDPTPRAIALLTTDMTTAWGVRASFTPLRRRFNLRVTLGDGSTHEIDIYRPPARSEEPPQYKVRPWQGIAPHPGRWTYRDESHGSLQPATNGAVDH